MLYRLKWVISNSRQYIVLHYSVNICWSLSRVSDPGDPLKFSYLHALLAQCTQSSLPVLLPCSTCLLPPGGLQHTLLAGNTSHIYAALLHRVVILSVHTVLLLCCPSLYTQHVFYVCLSWNKDPSSLTLTFLPFFSLLKILGAGVSSSKLRV